VTVNLSTNIFGTDAVAYLENTGQITPGTYTYASSGALASAELHFDLYTDGPSRTGIFQIRRNPSFFNILPVVANDAASARGNVALYDGSPFPFTVDCRNNSGCNLPGPSAPVFYAPLGAAISVDASSIAGTQTPFGNSYASTDISIQFRFLEADGVTPAMVHTGVPEPTTWAFLLIGGAFLCKFAIKREKALRSNS